jgi:hypothetical protein
VREIKFRGKQIDNGEWVYGSLIGGDVIVGDIIDFTEEYFNCEYWWRVKPETVGQYVPKEGFYEGDILGGGERDEYGTLVSRWFGVVKYDETTGRIRIEDDCGEWYETDDYMYDGVIGNIHDNPELFGARGGAYEDS